MIEWLRKLWRPDYCECDSETPGLWVCLVCRKTKSPDSLLPLSHGDPKPGGIRPGPDTGHAPSEARLFAANEKGAE